MTLPELTTAGELPAYAWPGGYPIYYMDGQGSTLCAKCATKSLKDPDEVPGFRPVACDVHYEGDAFTCENCTAQIESAYGDPDAEKTEEEVQP